MAGERRPQGDSTMAEINITPFTDVLLVLLIIFMILAALAVPPGFQKQVAGPTRHGRPADVHQIDVKVTAGDRIYIDGNLIGAGDLYAAVAQTVAYHTSHQAQGYSNHIALLGDKDTDYNTIIKILDAARNAGDEDVGFVTE